MMIKKTVVMVICVLGSIGIKAQADSMKKSQNKIQEQKEKNKSLEERLTKLERHNK